MGFFLPLPPAAGGATEKTWHRLALEFAARGHEVLVLSRRWPGWPDEETIAGVRHRRLPGFDHTSSLPCNLWRDFRWSRRVQRALPAADVTVVNCVALPALLGRSRHAGGRVAVMSGRQPKGQYRFYRHIDRVLAVSSAVKTAVLHENPRLADRITVTGYPIDCRLLMRPRAAVPAGSPLTIGFVGRLHREKGLDLFVAAVRLLLQRSPATDIRVVLCGPSSIAGGGSGADYARRLRRSLAALLPAARLDVYEPIFDEARLAELYRTIDVFCYPSLAARGETFGVAVAEAMAAGAVPVVSNLACFGDFVRAGENGEIFDHTAGDAADRLAAILDSLIEDAARRSRLARAAQVAAQQYDLSAFSERLLAAFGSSALT